jgi:predicted DsbA family dithiol-disulfide isomerase
MQLKVTYYLDVISSWCYWAEPAWAELKRRYHDVARFEWRIALLQEGGLPASVAQEEWFYRRSGVLTRSPIMLSTGWMADDLDEYLAANALAEAAKDFNVTDDRVRLALAHAALREGQKVGRWEVATPIAAAAAGVEPDVLFENARTQKVEDRIRASTAEFAELQVTQRPAFVIDDEIGDRAVFSGLATAAPLVATIEAMLADCAGYASWKAHLGDPPKD